MVEVKREVNAGILSGGFYERHEIGVLCIFARTRGNLEYDGRFRFGGSFGDSLYYLHVVDVEGAYGITAVIGFFEHFCGRYDSHFILPFLNQV